MTDLEDRKVALERELEVADAPPPLLHPNMAKVYSRKINAPYEALRCDDGHPVAADLLRTLIDWIVLEPSGDGLGILIKGEIAGILSFASADNELPAMGVRGRQVPVVAGAGFRQGCTKSALRKAFDGDCLGSQTTRTTDLAGAPLVQIPGRIWTLRIFHGRRTAAQYRRSKRVPGFQCPQWSDVKLNLMFH